jgi:hypothetical protein
VVIFLAQNSSYFVSGGGGGGQTSDFGKAIILMSLTVWNEKSARAKGQETARCSRQILLKFFM